ncbi:ATP-binding cassette domain-containing protein [Geoglobus acetivorans]|uniref:ABC transporter ATP-binding protein n=1 Tax=Geoglobus acetivorans TaxID=565033 RepID=A0ABZ3H2Z1_GEOAI|nr:ABC transporter ATP-binding protein [Geoglobus acetivorans]
MNAVECRDIWMVYRNFMEEPFTALKGISLEIGEGEVYCILGPNGAGKTTLISILSTILIPTRGEVRILGMDALRQTKEVRRRINISSGTRLPWGMRVYEILRFYALAYGISDKNVVDRALAEFELEKYRDLRFDELSAGNRQKLNLARAFINDPEVVFLDEPTANLDPDIARKVREMVLGIKEERNVTLILTTHNMGEAEMLADRIAFIKNGEIVAEGTSDELKRFVRSRDRIIVEVENPEIGEISLSRPYEIDGSRIVFYSESAEKELAEIVFGLKRAGFEIKSVKTEEVTLEDVFIELAK